MSNRTRLRNLTILLGSTTTVLAATIISPALPDMARAFQDTANADFLVRLTLTMPALLVALAAPFAGILLDRWGRKPVLAAALLLYAVAGTAGFFLDSLMAILLSRALLGLAVAGIMSGFITLILDYFEGDDLSRFMGYQGAFIGLGGMVFLLAAGFLADVGWRLPFLVHLFALVVLPGVLFALDEPHRERPQPTREQASERPRLPLGRLLPIYLAAFFAMAIFFVFVVQIPFHLSAQGGVSNTQVGLALSLQTLASIFIALQFQRMKARLSFQSIFVFIFLMFGLNHFIVAMTGSYWLVVAGLLIGGLGVGLMAPNTGVWIGSVTPAALRGLAVGGLTSALFLGQFFSPILTQPLIGRFGLSGTFAVAGVAALLLTVVFVIAARNRPRSRSQPESS